MRLTTETSQLEKTGRPTMPTILIQDGFRFFIPTLDHRPPHVHVEKSGDQAKFALEPVIELEKVEGMKMKDMNATFVITYQHREEFIAAFNKIIP